MYENRSHFMHSYSKAEVSAFVWQSAKDKNRKQAEKRKAEERKQATSFIRNLFSFSS